MKFNKEEFESSVHNIDEGVKTYITELKKKSSEEILNGSVEEAQSLISRIIPVETLYKSLSKTQNELLDLINDQMNNNDNGHSKNKDEDEEPKSADNDDPQPENEVKEKPKAKDDQLSDQKAYRIPILKGLIYLGGSAEVSDVIDFIKRDMKNKFTDKDSELIRADEDKWFKIVESEKDTMKSEGLLSSASENGSWEIVQKGIDYLSKNGK